MVTGKNMLLYAAACPHCGGGQRRLALMTFMVGYAGSAMAQLPSDIVWGNGQTLAFAVYACPSETPKLRIQGRLELLHPEDTDESAAVPEIHIQCDSVEFETGSKVLVRANLNVRAEVAILGHVDIENWRATPGADAEGPATLDATVRQRDGDPGSAGTPGSAVTYEVAAQELKAKLGEQGAAGKPGHAGEVGQDGDGGKSGTSAGSITLKARSYPGTIIALRAIGGAGGRGAQGGRGHDGGNGGTGGNGGKGGDGTLAWPPADGGSGGQGGDGGSGGQGGRGGDGGNGGAGGTLSVLILVDSQGNRGVPPSEIEWHGEGGRGGEPGIGGQGGQGGRGGKGGIAGCDGRLVGWFLGFGPSYGACGNPGPVGKDTDGADAFGTTGQWGREGMPGATGNLQLAYVKSQRN